MMGGWEDGRMREAWNDGRRLGGRWEDDGRMG